MKLYDVRLDSVGSHHGIDHETTTNNKNTTDIQVQLQSCDASHNTDPQVSIR